MPQSFAQIYLHVIFSTKNREPDLVEGWRDNLFGILGNAINEEGCQTILVGGYVDHVHLLFRMSRTITVADLVGRIKPRTSGWVYETKQPKRQFHWQLGYAAFSVDYTRLEIVREYIRKQPEHHAGISFQDELRAELTLHGLTWDERYIWE